MFLAYLPALVLAFSGLAVGYILWHRESRHDDALRQKLILQNSEMKQSVTLAKASYAALDERFTRQRGQLSVLQQLCDDWSASREQAEKERTELDVKLTERNKRNDELVAELKLARDQSMRLEDAVHNLTQNQLDKIIQIETTWQQKHVKVEAALASHQTEAKTVTVDRDIQRKKLHLAEARIAELESELKSNATTLENAKKNASGLEQEHVSLETALEHSKELLAKSEGQCAAERSEKESLIEQLSVAQKQSTAWQQQVEELKEEVAELQTYRTKSESLVLSLGNANGQLEKVLSQRDSALSSFATYQTTAKGLQARIDNQESSIHRLRKCQEDALENLKHELKVRREIEAKYDQRLADLRAKMAKQKEDFSKQLAQLNDSSGKQKQDFDAEVELLHEVAETAVLDLKKSLEEANSKISNLKTAQQTEGQKLKAFASLQSQFAQRETQLNELTSALQSSSSDYEQQITKLEAHREQLSKDLQSAREQLQSQLKQDSQTIGQLQSERDKLRGEVERLHEKIAELQTAIVAQERTHQQVADDSERLVEAQGKATRLEKELDRRENALKHLQAESNELARLRDEHASSLRRQAELQARLDSMMSDHLSQKGLREQIANHEQTIAELRAEIAGQNNATVISFTEAIQQRNESCYDPDYGGRVRRDSARGVVFTEAPESRDDLKRISGIATVLENRLNEFGIYTFKQIMDWQPEEIEEFSRLLTFRERIERDDWQGQARFFYQQKLEGSKVA